MFNDFCQPYTPRDAHVHNSLSPISFRLQRVYFLALHSCTEIPPLSTLTNPFGHLYSNKLTKPNYREQPPVNLYLNICAHWVTTLIYGHAYASDKQRSCIFHNKHPGIWREFHFNQCCLENHQRRLITCSFGRYIINSHPGLK